jgi:hypothetical protein
MQLMVNDPIEVICRGFGGRPQSRCQFHKHFKLVIYGRSKVSQCILKTLHGSVMHSLHGTQLILIGLNREY